MVLRGNRLRLAALAMAVPAAWVTSLPAQSPRPNLAPPLLVPPANTANSRPAIVATPAPQAAAPAAAPSLPSSAPAVLPDRRLEADSSDLPQSFTPSEESQQWITALVREHLPDKYEKSKNWGHTTKVWDGLKITTDDGRISTKRRWKEANDGTWYKYRVDLVEPEKHFDVRVENIREVEGGKISADVQVLARLKCFGRMSQWEHGVQLISLSADVDTTVALTAKVDLGMQLDTKNLPPDVLLVPRVRTARVDIVDFRLRRISNARGPLVKSLSSSVREVVEDKLEEQNRGKLAEKLNKQIAKQQDKLRLSLTDVVRSPWAKLLPDDTAPPDNTSN
jgi:hypothetical protein